MAPHARDYRKIAVERESVRIYFMWELKSEVWVMHRPQAFRHC